MDWRYLHFLVEAVRKPSHLALLYLPSHFPATLHHLVFVTYDGTAAVDPNVEHEYGLIVRPVQGVP